MPRRVLSLYSPLIRFAFFLLAFSVFSWGLQARLAQYKADDYSTASVKLSTGKRSSMSELTAPADDKPQPDFEKVAFALSFTLNHSAASSPNAVEQVELSLVTPARYDAQGPALMLRPPPVNS